METLSDVCKRHLLNTVITTRDKIKLLIDLELDTKIWAHYESYKFPIETDQQKEWTMEKYWSIWSVRLKQNSNPLPYECYQVFGRVNKEYSCWGFFNTGVYDIYKNIYLVFTKDGCYRLIPPKYLNEDDQMVKLNFEISEDIKPMEMIPIIKNLDDYMNIVAPHCEGLLDLFLTVYENEKDSKLNNSG